MGRERERNRTKGLRGKELAKGDPSGQSTPDSRETSWHVIGSRAVREDRSRWVGIPSSFVEISLEIYVSASLLMHKGMQCYITPLLAFELTQAYCSFVLFPPTPLIVFLVRSPYRNHELISGQEVKWFKEVDVSGSRGGMVTMVCLLAEWYDTKSNVKLGGFRSYLQASFTTKEL